MNPIAAWWKKTFSARGVTGKPVIQSKPLWLQHQRIGGNIGPADVTAILQRADIGQPDRFVDLTGESRQKDGHMHSCLATRENAVALTDLDFVEPPNATRKERKAVDLCRRIVDDHKNWQGLLEHLAGSFLHGHATAESLWEKTGDGLILPNDAKPIHARDFIFPMSDGQLRYRQFLGDMVGADILADNPGRIIQLQRRIVGDVPSREGLARILVWSALLRNWTLRDWVALGEVGWKPWRIGTYKAGAQQEDIDKLVQMLELIGSDGIGAVPDSTTVDVQWPKNNTGSGSTGTHRELFETLGREQSKAIIGNTTSNESGPNGTRGDTQSRDKIRADIREADCRSVAAALRYHVFMPAVAINIGGDVRVGAAVFQTDEGQDQLTFAQAIKSLRDAGLRIPADWVRDEVGMPKPKDADELLGPSPTEAAAAKPTAPQENQPAP